MSALFNFLHLSALQAGDREHRNAAEIHEICFYLLMLAIVLHVFAVVVTEVRERSGLISAMFSGIKYLPKKPED
jgi:cytochrome b